MSTPLLRINPAALTSAGDLLVFAPPILAGFHGAPLALAAGLSKRRVRTFTKKNWAKRRAYQA